MKILIVDDNANNRMVIKLLLEEYKEDSEIDLDIDEASDGQEAINKCTMHQYNIVLMDIMMPVLDGIEATKILNNLYPALLIVALSASDDAQRKKIILNNGAQDYISKPINADIFMHRMKNYLLLVKMKEELQTKEKLNQYHKNLFTNNIYSRYTTFMINSEDSLAEFWEAFLENEDTKCDELVDIIRTIFSIAEIQLRKHINSQVYIEESLEYQYFTLTISPQIAQKISKLSMGKCTYKQSKNKISFEVLKFSSFEALKEESFQEQPSEQPITIEKKALHVFDDIDQDDLFNLEEYASKLNSMMLIVGDDITPEEVEEISIYLRSIASSIASYSEIYKISDSLSKLSVVIGDYNEEFVKKSTHLGPICKAFAADICSWIDLSFYKGASSLDFMNDTIAVNCETIINMINPKEENDELFKEIDNIFDF